FVRTAGALALRKLYDRILADAACDASAYARDLCLRADRGRLCRRGPEPEQAGGLGARAGSLLRRHPAPSGVHRASRYGAALRYTARAVRGPAAGVSLRRGVQRL